MGVTRWKKRWKKWGCKYNLHDFELRCCTFNRLQSRTWFERVACAIFRRLPCQAACRLAGGACGESSVSVWAKGDLCSCIAVAQLWCAEGQRFRPKPRRRWSLQRRSHPNGIFYIYYIYMICELTWPLIALEQADNEMERTVISENWHWAFFKKVFSFRNVWFLHIRIFKKQSSSVNLVFRRIVLFFLRIKML